MQRHCRLTPARRPHTPSFLQNTWTLHGLWAEPPRSKRTDSQFSSSWKSLRQTLKDFVDDYWTALCYPGADLKKQQEGFLKHEWEEHGKAYSVYNNLEYFVETAKDYFNRFDIYYLLKKHNIVPSSSSYNTKDVISALETELGRDTFVLKCARNTDDLMEVHVCLGRLKSGDPTTAYPCGRYFPSNAPRGNCYTSRVYYLK